jgi:N-acetyl-anhydromuramyl-L-alanine amidase AmpD
VPYRFVESPNKTETSGRTFDVVVMHTMEIAERPDAAMICARWFATSVSKVSAHYCVDAQTVVQCVREKDVAWHARGGNSNSIGIELAGYAGQRALGWNDPYSRAVVERAARLTADVCARHGIPLRRLRAADLVAGKRGVTGHADVSAAFHKSDHWDPGLGYPDDIQMSRIRWYGGVADFWGEDDGTRPEDVDPGDGGGGAEPDWFSKSSTTMLDVARACI